MTIKAKTNETILFRYEICILLLIITAVPLCVYEIFGGGGGPLLAMLSTANVVIPVLALFHVKRQINETARHPDSVIWWVLMLGISVIVLFAVMLLLTVNDFYPMFLILCTVETLLAAYIMVLGFRRRQVYASTRRY